MVISLCGRVSVFFFPLPPSSVVALPAFRPLGLPLTFFNHSFLLLTLPSGCFCLYHHLFSSVDVPSLSYRSSLSFCGGGLGHGSVYPGPGFCPCSSSVLVRICVSSLLWCFLHCSLYIRPFGSSWSASFRFFFLFTFAASFGSQFLRNGVALWDESVASVGSFAFFSGSFSGSLYAAA